MTATSPIRLVVLINSLGAGGTERSTAVVLPLLREHGIESEVVMLKHEPIGDEAAVRDAGIAVSTLVATSFVGRAREFRAALLRNRPDVVHTAIFDADQVGRVAALGTGIPVVSSLVNTPYDPARFLDPNVAAWKLRLTQAADAATARVGVRRFHAVSSGVAEANIAALHLRSNRVVVVERGRDLGELDRSGTATGATVRTELGIEPTDFVVLAVGRQEFQKAQDDLVRGFAEFARTVPDSALMIAGRVGHGSRALADAIAMLDDPVRRRVHVLGHRNDIADLLAASDVFAMPSRYEGTSGAAIEAMAAGVPVVHSKVAGIEGVLTNDHDALLVPVGDTGALVAALQHIHADGELRDRLICNGRNSVARSFDLDRAARRMAELYRATVEEHTTTAR